MPSDQYDKSDFDRTANDPAFWITRADDLYLSAKILYDKSDSMTSQVEQTSDTEQIAALFRALRYSGIVFPATMLLGFSVETLLKAFWITQGNTVSDDGEYKILTIRHDNHNLPLIADGVGFKLSDREREVLERLSLFVSSYGRYPITKKWHQNRLKKNAGGVLNRVSWNVADHETVEAIIQRLKATMRPN
jgi:hypothetical protein